MPFRSLSAKIKGDSSSYVSATERAQASASRFGDEAQSLSANLQLLQGRAEEAGDEISATGRDARQTSRSFAVLSVGTQGLNASFGVLSTTMSLSLIPALALLATTLAPLVVVFGGVAAAAGSLAAVFGGLAATGVVTHMDELQTALAEARTEIVEIIAPLGDVFGPLLVRAVEALPDLVQGIVDSLGPMDQFREGLVEFGRFAMQAIPAVTGFMFDLATGSLPVLNDAMQSLMNNAGQASGVIATLADAFWATLPLVVELGGALADMGGPLLELGTNVASVVLPAFTTFIDLLTAGMAALNEVTPTIVAAFKAVQETVGAGLETATRAVADFASALGLLEDGRVSMDAIVVGVSALTGPIGTAAAALWRFRDVVGEAMAAAVEGVTAFVDGAVEGFGGNINALLEEITGLFAVFGETVAASVSVAVGSLEGLAPSAESVGRVVGASIGGAVDTATIALRTLEATSQAVAAAVAGLWQRHGSQITGVVQQISTQIQNVASVVMPLVHHMMASVLGMVASLWKTHGRQIMQSVRQVAGIVSTVFSTALDVILTVTQTTLNLVSGLWNAFGQDIANIVRAAFDVLLPIVRTVLSNFLSIVDGVTDLLTGDWRGAWNSIKQIVTTTITGIIDFIKGVPDLIAAAIGLVIDTAKASFAWLIGTGTDTIVGAVKGTFNAWIDWTTNILPGLVEDAIGAVIETVKDAFGYLTGTGDNSLLGDIVDAIAGIGEAAAGAFAAAWNNTLGGTRLAFPDIDYEGFYIKELDQWIVPPFEIEGPGITIPKLQSGGFIEESGLAMLHSGEQVVPAADVRDRGQQVVVDRRGGMDATSLRRALEGMSFRLQSGRPLPLNIEDEVLDMEDVELVLERTKDRADRRGMRP